MATALGAAVTVVVGPGTEEQVGRRERGEPAPDLPHAPGSRPRRSSSSTSSTRSPPARGTYTGSGVEHSMVNQLLTEMDGFHTEETGLRRRHDELRRDPRPGAAAARPLRVPPAHPLSRRRRPPRDPRDLRPEDAAADDRRRRWITRSSAPATGLPDADRHAVQRRPPQRPVPVGRPHPAARGPHRRRPRRRTSSAA